MERILHSDRTGKRSHWLSQGCSDEELIWYSDKEVLRQVAENRGICPGYPLVCWRTPLAQRGVQTAGPNVPKREPSESWSKGFGPPIIWLQHPCARRGPSRVRTRFDLLYLVQQTLIQT